VRGDERRFRGDRDRDDVVGGPRPDLRERARAPPGGKLLPKTRKNAGTYSDVPPDTHLPMQPGISGHW
jgi:hypothetical protein